MLGRRPTRTLRGLLCALLALCSLAAAAPAAAPAAQTAGIHTHLLWSRYDAADRERMLDQAKAAGAGIVRVDVGWSSIEIDEKGTYSQWYLNKVDHVVDEAEKRGIKLLFTFWETPCWASTAPASLKQGCEGAWWDREVQRYAPANPRDYAEALAFMVRRYGDRVAAWELWNEPNHDHYLKGADKAGLYAAMVKAAYPAAKAADPDSTIIAGSLADADFEFTQALLDRGVGGHFDAWSVHPYSEDRSPLHPGIEGWSKKSFSAGVPQVRETLLAAGEDKPIWLTEFGWSTCTVRGDRAWRNCVDPATQAAYLQQALAHMQKWSYVPVATTFNLEDTSSDPGDRVDNYGLLNEDGSPKPAYAAFKTGALAIAAGTSVPVAAPAPGTPAPAPTPDAPASAAAAPAKAPQTTAAEAAPRVLNASTGDADRAAPAAGAPREARRGRIEGGSVTLRAVRRGGRVRIRGNLSWGRTLHVRAYRWKRGERRYSRRTSYRALIRVRPNGNFRNLLRTGRLRRGKWLIVVKGRRTPRLSARDRVR